MLRKNAVSAMLSANHLFEALPRKARSSLLVNCTLVDLVSGVILCEPEQPFLHVYFPVTGFISLVTILRDHQPLEIGLIGNEGMLGATLALGVNAAPLRAMVQGEGTALRMTASQFRRELVDYPATLKTLNRYIYVLLAQQSRNAACIHFHAIEPRLARWLLTTCDRARSDHFHLTHEFLGMMLGVRRSGITVAAGSLQQRKLISYSRGEIAILDRNGLEAASCECYSVVSADYTRLFG